jgi:hypothetical protein
MRIDLEAADDWRALLLDALESAGERELVA